MVHLELNNNLRLKMMRRKTICFCPGTSEVHDSAVVWHVFQSTKLIIRLPDFTVSVYCFLDEESKARDTGNKKINRKKAGVFVRESAAS